jgi:hypothetical protein
MSLGVMGHAARDLAPVGRKILIRDVVMRLADKRDEGLPAQAQ